jgi:hypothetical protein
MRTLGLAIPARDARQTVCDILDLDVEWGGIEEVEPAALEHSLPRSMRLVA